MRSSISQICVAAVLLAATTSTPIRSTEASTPGDSQETTVSDNRLQGDLTLDDAISLALQFNQTLAAAAVGVSAADERLNQAGLYANPEINLEFENFGGNDELSGFDGAETTFAISQPLLLGGKIAGRKGVAEADLALANRELDAVRLDVMAITTIAFNNVIVAQERVELTKKLAELANSLDDTVKTRIEAGKVSPVEGVRTRAAVARAQVDVAKANRALAAARVRLATTWGSSDPLFGRAVGHLRPSTRLPPRTVLDEMLMQTPEIARLTEELTRQEHVMKLEEARGVPDLTLTLGPRKYQETDSWAWVGGVSLPLPVFNRNQGARRAAEFEIERTRLKVSARRIALEGRLSTVLEKLRALGGEVRSYEQEIVPASAEAFEAISLGFREGKFGFLEVLDAQRSLSEAALLLLESQQRHSAARAELERLVGSSLDEHTDAAATANNPTQGEVQ